MSYQVLARKWRPKKFAELVGQEHVVRALSNALEADRTHHAYLFTGTRGVGKTTIARIFAKSINCERGQSAEPCGECAVCTAVDAGRFVDLLEIDAASNTGVDDVREVIENAQYAPSRGRYKVYLVDEVHMLSKSAFNALLKTLEEPPPHVKFLLATTDPQKLPMTVLSRCLKFSLKRLLPQQIAGQMRHILAAEGIAFDDAAIAELARAADGSLRDGLSLLDQAIAYGGGSLKADETRAMLGSVAQSNVLALLQALAAGDGRALLDEAARIAEFAPDFGGVLDQLAQALHRIQLIQLVPGLELDDSAELTVLAGQLDAEEVQLFYQLAGLGRRDLPLAPDARSGFEMCLLRMLAFRPATDAELLASTGKVAVAARMSPPATGGAAAAAPARPSVPEPAVAPSPPPAAVARVEIRNAEDWRQLVEQGVFAGPLGQLAQNATLGAIEGVQWTLLLRPEHMQLAIEPMLKKMEQRVAELTGQPIKLRCVSDAAVSDTVATRREQVRVTRQAEAEQTLDDDPLLRRMQQELGARVVPESIRHED
ncbi:MAG TPA: DNA polymerase III subunit gamma/tau [Rhodanobacteraceae bacterium]|nr:DNA polymerase III subunit gamma/tau [Rhodanobacteraceae bacterium]